MDIATRGGRATAWSAAIGVSVLGAVAAGLSLAWLAGSFGLSAAAATQIVTAIEVGGAALAIVSAVLSGGVAGAVISTVVWYLKKKLRDAAIA